jgi:phospholipid/cholesterol/gamma-HCH transport system permease protein
VARTTRLGDNGAVRAERDPAAPAFGIDAVREDGYTRLRLAGTLTAEASEELWDELGRHLEAAETPVRIDLAGVDRLDGVCAAILLERQACVRGGVAVTVEGARPDVARMLDLYALPSGQPCLKPPPARTPILVQVGAATADVVAECKVALAFIGELIASTGAALRSPRSVHWRDVPRLMERAGADGLPICALINFLVGLIMGFQSAVQLKRFGADVFLADLVGLSITRELGPLMTAIIVAGRSGAAFAAELGTMRVYEEIDALRTLAIDPQRFLVVPRVIALAVVVPLLTILGDVIGCLGGLVVAVVTLDQPMIIYTNELQKAVDLWDVGGGLLKSAVFAVIITLISCQRGLATRGGAAGVGNSTTSAVVLILFSLVAADSVFAVVFNALGI